MLIRSEPFNVVPPPVSLPSSYVGPGDIVSGWSAFWGLRAFSAATVGNKIINARGNDGTTADIHSLSSGALDSVTLAAFIVSHGSPTTITRFYDQTGNGNDIVQGTVANQAVINQSPLYAMFDGLATSYNTSGNLVLGQPFTMAIGATFSSVGGSDYVAMYGDAGGVAASQAAMLIQGFTNPTVGLRSTANGGTTLFDFAFIGSQGQLFDEFAGIAVSFNGAASFMMVNGVINIFSPGSTGLSGQFYVGSFETTNAFCPMHFFEAGIINAPSTDQCARIAYNQQRYWNLGTFTLDQAYEAYGGGLFTAQNIPESTGYTLLEVTVPNGTFPDSAAGAVLNYNISGASGANVFAFPSVAYGAYGPTQGGAIPQKTITPKQINSISTLMSSHSLSYTINAGTASDFDIIYDMYLTTGTNSGSSVIEFEVWAHSSGQSPSGNVGSFTDSQGTVWIVSELPATPNIYSFIPTGNVDLLNYTVDILAMFNFLISKSVLTGTEFFGGFALGSEPFSTSAAVTVTINSLSVVYN